MFNIRVHIIYAYIGTSQEFRKKKMENLLIQVNVDSIFIKQYDVYKAYKAKLKKSQEKD